MRICTMMAFNYGRKRFHGTAYEISREIWILVYANGKRQNRSFAVCLSAEVKQNLTVCVVLI